ncbi:hypothetical protein FFI89_011175 [Bradyrhizobium sp. KBS0727]|nr:hypothetical protein FFI89_011175 [Bradyrhizobium sp. KBS0727]
MNALAARRNTRLPAMMAKNNLSKRSTPQSAQRRSRLEGFGCVDSLAHVRRSSGKSARHQGSKTTFLEVSSRSDGRIEMRGEKPVRRADDAEDEAGGRPAFQLRNFTP